MSKTWRLGLPNSMAECTVERIGRKPREECTYRRPMAGNDRWASLRWKTRSSTDRGSRLTILARATLLPDRASSSHTPHSLFHAIQKIASEKAIATFCLLDNEAVSLRHTVHLSCILYGSANSTSPGYVSSVHWFPDHKTQFI